MLYSAVHRREQDSFWRRFILEAYHTNNGIGSCHSEQAIDQLGQIDPEDFILL